MTADQISQMILAGMPEADVQVITDDNTHFEARVVSAEFDGLRSLQRHKKVYATLGAFMGREIHALALKTYSTQEWTAQQSS